MQINQRMKDLREDADKSQTQIARILKITQQQYGLYETGKREMPIKHYITLAKYYDVSLDYLAGLINFPEKLRR